MIDTALLDMLSNDPGITALVGPRIHPVSLPATPTYPALVYAKKEVDREYGFDGFNGFAKSKFQIDCWAESHADAKDVASAVRGRMDEAQGVFAGITITGVILDEEADVYDKDLGKVQVLQTYIILHNE